MRYAYEFLLEYRYFSSRNEELHPSDERFHLQLERFHLSEERLQLDIERFQSDQDRFYFFDAFYSVSKTITSHQVKMFNQTFFSPRMIKT